MKNVLIASMLALTSSAVMAAPFEFQRQFGSSEYVFDADTQGMHFAPVAARDFIPSLSALMLEANVDGIAPNAFVGRFVPGGPSRISLYEVYRDSPEGTAYRGYHERYPAGTDWDRVAREFRAQQTDEGLAAEAGREGDRS